MKRSTRRNLLIGFSWLSIALLACGCASKTCTFIVASDLHEPTKPGSGTPADFRIMAEAIRSVGPGEFMLTPGDLGCAEQVRATLDELMGPEYPWDVVPGNHDIVEPGCMTWIRQNNEGGRKLPRIVRSGPPGAVETCYSFDYGDAHFVAINEYYDGQHDQQKGGAVSDALYRWLEEDLSSNRKPIIFVFGHEPYLPLPDMDTGRLRHRGDSLDANPAEQQRFWSLLRAHNVTAFICGHTHCVSVAKFNGVWQLNCGITFQPAKPDALGTFLRIRIDSGRVFCDVYRGTGSKPWELTYSEQLR